MDVSYTEDQNPGIAQKLLTSLEPLGHEATVVGLTGDLGAGKTSLVKAIASELGVTETVVSPTFVIAKFYEVPSGKWERLIHVDAYRIDDDSELDSLNWDQILQNPKALVIVEWPERIKYRLPSNTKFFTIDHEENSRRIKTKEKDNETSKK